MPITRRSQKQIDKTSKPLQNQNVEDTEIHRKSKTLTRKKSFSDSETRLSTRRKPSSQTSYSTNSSDESSTSDSDDEDYVSVEKHRQKIEKKKQELLRRLNVHQAAADLRAAFKTSTNVDHNKNKRKVISSVPLRKSLRLQHVKPSSDIEMSATVEDVDERPSHLIPNHEHALVAFKFKSETEENESSQSQQDYMNFMKNVSVAHKNTTKKKNTNSVSFDKYAQKLKEINERGCRFEKVVDKRIYSMCISHSDMLLVAAGSISGQIGLWDINNRDVNHGVYQFPAHMRPVTHMMFSHIHHNLLFSSSYDGSLRTMDLHKCVFLKALIDLSDDNPTLSSFDLQSSSGDIVIAGTSHGDIITCDTRQKDRKIETYQAHNRVIKSISVHPVERQYFATASNDCTVKIFDFRFLTKRLKDIATLREHTKSIDSAFFSPLAGRKLLTTSLDNRIRLYDTTDISDIQLLHSMHHNNFTGRWLSNFKANWHPTREDVIVVGSMKHPRQIDLLDSSLETFDSLIDVDKLQSVCSCNCIHPMHDVIIGGNSSGKVFVFGNK